MPIMLWKIAFFIRLLNFFWRPILLFISLNILLLHLWISSCFSSFFSLLNFFFTFKRVWNRIVKRELAIECLLNIFCEALTWHLLLFKLLKGEYKTISKQGVKGESMNNICFRAYFVCNKSERIFLDTHTHTHTQPEQCSNSCMISWHLTNTNLSTIGNGAK